MSYNFYNFENPSTGICCEYELFLNIESSDESQELVEFGFAIQESPCLKFSAKGGKLYDNEGNFIYGLGNKEDDIEIYGNIFEDYFNYSIDRVPINTNCSKVFGKGIDSFFTSESGITFSLKVNDRV